MNARGLLALILPALALASPARAQTAPDLSSPPAGNVLDGAQLFSGTQVETLAKSLAAAAKQDGVLVYFVTVPTVNTQAPTSKERIEKLVNKLAADWTDNVIGAVALFDYETGLASIATSKLAAERFTEAEINIRLGRDMTSVAPARWEGDRLIQTTLSVTKTLQELQREWLGKRRRIAILLALIVLTIVAVSAFRVTRQK